MKLHQDSNDALNTVTAYDQGYIEINAERHQGGVFFMPDGPVRAWPPCTIQDVDAAMLEILLEHRPEIVLLGTGARQHFAAPALLAPLIRDGTGYEFMSTPAACRTYNILMSEGRQVMAAVLPILDTGSS